MEELHSKQDVSWLGLMKFVGGRMELIGCSFFFFVEGDYSVIVIFFFSNYHFLEFF